MILPDALLQKMLNVISHAGNANKTTLGYHCTPIRMAKTMMGGHTNGWPRHGQLAFSNPAAGRVERDNQFAKHFDGF